MTGNINLPNKGNFNQKSKTRKRLKFTMRNEKIIASRMQMKKEKNFDLNLKVLGQSGFISNLNDGGTQESKDQSTHK